MSSKKGKKIPEAIARVAPDGQPTARQRRRIMIEISLRRIQPGSYSSPEFYSRRTAVHTWPDLHDILGDIPWLVTGGVATRAYMPERSTNDIDIVIRRSDCTRAWSRFREAGFSVASTLDAPYFVARAIETPEVDVICGDFPWLEKALQTPKRDAANLPIIGLPYLIIMKLRANRGVDIGDMTRMLGLAPESEIDRVRETVKEYAPEDADDLEALIILGKMEFRDQRK
jgi:hypothetical protein